MISDQKPPEYSQGKAIFCGQKFIVSPDVLIPRIETEEIIDLVCHPELVSESICDIGCGSGCLGIILSQKFPKAIVYLSDISEGALKIAAKNVKLLNVKLLKSDLLENYPDILFDIIVANLPYVPTSRIKKLSGSVKNFEPHLALDGGPKGTTLINRLLKQLPQHLKLKGLAILEIDDTHTIKSFEVPKSLKAQIKKDQFGRNRFLILRWI